MPRSRRPALIFVAAALLSVVAVLTADTPIGAWERFADTRPDDRLSDAQLEGKSFRMLVSCFPSGGGYPFLDLWQFLAGGELVGVSSSGTWEQTTPVTWKANTDVCFSGQAAEFQGLSLGPAILGFAQPEKVVVGIRARP